ncbi:hypothetical protein [Methylosinus sp. sav-2]|uniref:hypothetical protein n=1 Tax=Methylosinus sp. sav-2 TaxID=2485168 RepID=UPI001416F02E|nr:hypothetical protein [Methylosinus sp. sav-2]
MTACGAGNSHGSNGSTRGLAMSRRRWRQNATVGFLACSYCLWPSALGFAGPGGCDKAARDYLTEYCTEIAPEDQVSNKGEALSDAVAILQQDRFNVHVRGLRRKGDSVDAYFAGTTHCVEIAGAMLTIDKETSAAIVDGNPSLLLDVYRHKSNGRLEFSVGVSGEAPPEGIDAAETLRPLHEIPLQYHGKWAYSAHNCTGGETTAVLAIDSKGLHQSEGEMIALGVLPMGSSRRTIIINTRNSGGGGKWDSTEELTLSSDSAVLEWRTVRPYPSAVSRLVRCR